MCLLSHFLPYAAWLQSNGGKNDAAFKRFGKAADWPAGYSRSNANNRGSIACETIAGR